MFNVSIHIICLQEIWSDCGGSGWPGRVTPRSRRRGRVSRWPRSSSSPPSSSWCAARCWRRASAASSTSTLNISGAQSTNKTRRAAAPCSASWVTSNVRRMSRNKKNDLQSVGKSLTFRGTVNEARELMKSHKCSDPVCSTQLLRVRDKKGFIYYQR